MGQGCIVFEGITGHPADSNANPQKVPDSQFGTSAPLHTAVYNDDGDRIWRNGRPGRPLLYNVYSIGYTLLLIADAERHATVLWLLLLLLLLLLTRLKQCVHAEAFGISARSREGT